MLMLLYVLRAMDVYSRNATSFICYPNHDSKIISRCNMKHKTLKTRNSRISLVQFLFLPFIIVNASSNRNTAYLEKELSSLHLIKIYLWSN